MNIVKYIYLFNTLYYTCMTKKKQKKTLTLKYKKHKIHIFPLP